MDLNIADKTALVTASSSGIGLAAATAIAAEGAAVVLNGRDEDRLKQAEERLRERCRMRRCGWWSPTWAPRTVCAR